MPGDAKIIIDSLASATMTGYLTGFYKKAYSSAQDKAIVTAAILSGLFSVMMVSMASGDMHLTKEYIGTVIMQGISAAGLSAAVQVVNKPPQSMK